jgi:beta-lactamase superfamily II metal-dependent hydrolase
MPFLLAVRPRVSLAASGIAPRYPYPARAVLERVRGVPAVVLAQREGAAVASWPGDGEPIVVDGGVSVRIEPGRARR